MEFLVIDELTEASYQSVKSGTYLGLKIVVVVITPASGNAAVGTVYVPHPGAYTAFPITNRISSR